MPYKINKEKCTGCGSCVAACPEGMKMGEDGKAEIVDQEKVKNCGGKDLCGFGAIEETEE